MAYLCHAGRRGRRGKDTLRAHGRRLATAACAAAALSLLAAACAGRPSTSATSASGADRRPFELDHDVFAFSNLVRAQRPGLNDDFANYCLIMARAASQFYRFARFAPERAAVTPAEYERLTRQVLDRLPWAPAPASASELVVIPGYADLRAFSAAQETTLKAAFGSNVLSMFHWRTWRVGVDFSPAHQEELARELVKEVEAGRPAPVMITNFPHEDLLNHSVLVYAHRSAQQGTDFLAYDPNDPASPFTLYYDTAARAFWVGPLAYSPAGRVRAFRLYTSPLF